MDKGQEHILKGIVYEYGDLINIDDAEIVAQGSVVTSIVWNEDTDKLEFYAGNFETDKNAEQIFPNEDELNEIYEYVVYNF